MLKLQIKRYKNSYYFKADPKKPDSFSNNWKNNGLDDFVLAKDALKFLSASAGASPIIALGICPAGIRSVTGTALPQGNLRYGVLCRRGSFTGRYTR